VIVPINFCATASTVLFASMVMFNNPLLLMAPFICAPNRSVRSRNFPINICSWAVRWEYMLSAYIRRVSSSSSATSHTAATLSDIMPATKSGHSAEPSKMRRGALGSKACVCTSASTCGSTFFS
jgi:hypothetical protein